jgi:hypothetical protein
MTLLSFIIIIVALGTTTDFKDGLKTYSVKKITATIEPTGKGDHPLWKNAHELSDFHYPWEKETPLPTKFKALHNNSMLYCLFEVVDDNINILQDKNYKSEVASSSRVEIFFKIDDKLLPYYCMEIDPLGRVLDYEGTYHRNFNSEWSWPEGHLTVKTERRKGGYSVEVAITKASLKKLGLLKNKTLQAGLYRADCFKTKSGAPDFKWISWVKPDSKTPDFHIPSSFGILRLED